MLLSLSAWTGGVIHRRSDTLPVDIAIPIYGYKSHVSIDRMHGVIRRQIVTDAAQHDGARLREGLIQTANTARGVWADRPTDLPRTSAGSRFTA